MLSNRKLSVKSGRRAAAPFFRPVVEVLEDRLAPAVANYWVGGSPTAPNAWEADTNWSLNHQPTSTEDAIFDAGESATPCSLGQGRVATPASVQMSGNWASTLTVNGNITTPSFIVNAREATGAEVTIAAGGQVEVTSAMTFAGGNVSGTGRLLMDSLAKLTVTGTSAADPPTLGCPLQLGSADGTSAGSMDFGNAAVQPLVVTGTAGITVNLNSNITFNGKPLPGNTNVTAISNADGGRETIVVSGGLLISGGDYEQIVGMGVSMTSGQIIAGSSGRTLHFTGLTTSGYGLSMSNGDLTVRGSMAFDNSANITGGTVSEDNGNSTLTLGLAAASPLNQLRGGTVNLPGTLVAHSGFQMTAGTLNTTGSTASIVTVDNGTTFTMSGGQLNVTQTNPQTFAVSGQLTVNGNFQATAGSLVINVSTAVGNTQGLLQVNGNATFRQGLTLSCSDQNPNVQQVNMNWILFQFTGTFTGGFTVSIPDSWTYQWDATNKRFIVHEP